MKLGPDDERKYIFDNYYGKSNEDMALHLERSTEYIKDRLREFFSSGQLRPKKPGALRRVASSATGGPALQPAVADKAVAAVRRMLQAGTEATGTMKHAFVMSKCLVGALKAIAKAKRMKHKLFLEEALVAYTAGLYRDDPLLVERAFSATRTHQPKDGGDAAPQRHGT